jgi:hypothetical protein
MKEKELKGGDTWQSLSLAVLLFLLATKMTTILSTTIIDKEKKRGRITRPISYAFSSYLY